MRAQMAIASYGNSAANLCQKPAQKGGTPLAGGHRGCPWGGKGAQKCPGAAPKSTFQTSAEAGKVMKYSIFSAPGTTESLLEWGGASVRPRAEIFLRGGGSLLGELSSVCPPGTLKKPGF